MSLANLLLAASAAAFVFIPGAGVMAARAARAARDRLVAAVRRRNVAGGRGRCRPARLGQAIGLYGGANLAMHAHRRRRWPSRWPPGLGRALIFVLASLSALCGGLALSSAAGNGAGARHGRRGPLRGCDACGRARSRCWC